MKSQLTKGERDWIESFRDRTGLYAFYAGGACLYVGKADCLASRIFQHFKKRKDVEEVGVYDITEWLSGLPYHAFKCLLAFKESCLIRQLCPLENIKRPKFTIEALHRMPVEAKRKLIDDLPSTHQ